MLLWRFSGVKRTQVTDAEWAKGWASLCVGEERPTIAYVRDNVVPQLDAGFLEHLEFRGFYRYLFEVNLEGTLKFLDMDTAMELLPLACGNRSPYVESFQNYCRREANDQNHMTRDEWMSFLDFSQQTSSLATAAADEDSAWPVLIDDWVAWTQSAASSSAGGL